LVYDTTKDTNESEKKHFASRKIVEFNLRAIRGVFPELSHHEGHEGHEGFRGRNASRMERSPNSIFVLFVHFVVFFLVFNTTKDLALASPATQNGEEYEPRKTRKKSRGEPGDVSPPDFASLDL